MLRTTSRSAARGASLSIRGKSPGWRAEGGTGEHVPPAGATRSAPRRPPLLCES